MKVRNETSWGDVLKTSLAVMRGSSARISSGVGSEVARVVADSCLVDPAQLRHRVEGFLDALLEHRDLIEALLPRHAQRLARRAAGPRIDHLGNLGQREAKLLSLEDETEVLLIGRAIDTRSAVARRAEQPFAFVKTQRARRDVEPFRHLANGEELGRSNGSGRLDVDPHDVRIREFGGLNNI